MKIDKFANRAIVTNVSRRNLLKGIVGMAGVIQPVRTHRCFRRYKTGADGCRAGVVRDPHIYVPSPGRNRDIVTHRRNGNGSRTSLPMASRTRWKRTGPRVKIVRRRATSRSMAIRTPMAQAASATSSSRCGRAALQRGRCWSTQRQFSGVFPTPSVARRTTRLSSPPPSDLGYGELAAAAAAAADAKASAVTLKDPSQFPLHREGQVQIVDLFDITTGKAMYAQDIHVPGMRYAVVARAPVVLGKVATFDEAAAMRCRGS